MLRRMRMMQIKIPKMMPAFSAVLMLLMSTMLEY